MHEQRTQTMLFKFVISIAAKYGEETLCNKKNTMRRVKMWLRIEEFWTNADVAATITEHLLLRTIVITGESVALSKQQCKSVKLYTYNFRLHKNEMKTVTTDSYQR